MSDTPAQKQPSFEERINQHVTEVTRDDEGSLVFPDDMDESTKFAVTAEIRRRDTQASYSRTQAELKQLKAENDRIAAAWGDDVASNLTAEQREELDELKATDPEAWRTKINQYEADNKTAFAERRSKISEEARNETELERRTRLLEEHNTANPDFQLTDEVIQNDLPPRIVNDLSSGKITFDEFLEKAGTYLGKPKVIKSGDEPLKGPNLGS